VGDIVNFEPKRSGKDLPKRAASANATVIIFPGVRYERLAGASAKMRAGGKSKQSPCAAHYQPADLQRLAGDVPADMTRM
jgi:hypothetical protein